MVTGQLFMTLKQKRNNILHNTYKELSIQISLNGLSFCIYNTLESKVEELQSITFNNELNPETLLDKVKSITSENDSLQQKFDSLRVFYVNSLSTFVPEPIFNEENLADYLKYNIQILNNDFITFDEIKKNEIINVYVPFVNINNYLLDWYGEFEYEHFATVLVSKLLSLPTNVTDNHVYIHFSSNNEFQIVAIQQKKLTFYNTFKYNSPEDFIYFVLFSFEQYNWDTEAIKTTLIGAISKNDQLFEMIYKFIRHVDIYTPPLPASKLILSDSIIKSNFILLNSTH